MLEIPDAARKLCRQTPLVFGSALGCWLKLESLQATGSFKLRGAALKLARLVARGHVGGVVAASAGNHGLGIALAAGRMGLRATVVIPERTPAVKRDGIARLGADVIISGSTYDEAEWMAKGLAEERRSVFVSPYDDDDVIDGNGAWLGAELLAQRPVLKRVVVPVGGGGLAGGLARELSKSGVRVVGVQPRMNCAMHESLAHGEAQTVYVGRPTLCEGLEGAVSERTYRLARDHLAEIVLVDEDEVLAAMAFAYRALGIVVEASAAVGIAATRAGRIPRDDATAIIITGSNVEPDMLDRALEASV